jgi:hypothetical protein
MSTHVEEKKSGASAAPPLKDMEAGDYFKIGGTTIGTTSMGAMVGSFFGAPGAVAGAAIGGLAGAAVSIHEAIASHKKR